MQRRRDQWGKWVVSGHRSVLTLFPCWRVVSNLWYFCVSDSVWWWGIIDHIMGDPAANTGSVDGQTWDLMLFLLNQPNIVTTASMSKLRNQSAPPCGRELHSGQSGDWSFVRPTTRNCCPSSIFNLLVVNTEYQFCYSRYLSTNQH